MGYRLYHRIRSGTLPPPQNCVHSKMAKKEGFFFKLAPKASPGTWWVITRVARIRENHTDPDPFGKIFTDPDPDPKRIRPISKNCCEISKNPNIFKVARLQSRGANFKILILTSSEGVAAFVKGYNQGCADPDPDPCYFAQKDPDLDHKIFIEIEIFATLSTK